MRRTLLLALTSLLVLTACGSDGGGDLKSVKVGDGKNPSVTVEAGFTTTSTTSRVVADGSGEELEDGDVVKLNYVAVNGRTGKQFDNSFKSGSPMTVPLAEGNVLPGFIKGLTGQKVGSRVLVAIPPKDGFGQAQETFDIKADDSMVFLFDIVGKVPEKASGEAKKLPTTVPSITLKDDEPSGFKPSKKTTKNPKKAASYVTIQGDGDKVEKGATVTAHYVGQVYPDGEVFDSSWERGSSTPFSLDSVIPCWQDQIPGHTVGSRIVLVCPADDAYGDSPPEGSAIKAGDTLIFAVDLLDAS